MHRSTDFSCFISFQQEVTSYTWILIACGYRLVRMVLSSEEESGEALYAGASEITGPWLQLGLYVVVEGFGGD